MRAGLGNFGWERGEGNPLLPWAEVYFGLSILINDVYITFCALFFDLLAVAVVGWSFANFDL